MTDMGKAYDDFDVLRDRTDRDKMPKDFLDIRDRFVDMLEPDDKVLSAGFGGAHGLKYFQQNGLEVYGVDLSKSNVEGARDLGFDVRKEDMKDMSFPDNYFDGIWCCTSIHFNDHERMVEAAEELYRVTDEGGMVHITFKIGEDEFYVEERADVDLKHYLVSEDYAKEIVSAAGYKSTETEVNASHREEFDYFMNIFAEKPEK